MAQPVRPPVWPPAPIPAARPDARLSAQKAFFEAALGGKPPAANAAPPPPSVAPAQAVRSVAEADARANDRLPPPGSIVNILV
jgi:hypothetical protein